MPISVTGHSFALIGVGGGLGIVPFDAIEAGQAIVVLFDDGRVEELFAVGIAKADRPGDHHRASRSHTSRTTGTTTRYGSTRAATSARMTEPPRPTGP